MLDLARADRAASSCGATAWAWLLCAAVGFGPLCACGGGRPAGASAPAVALPSPTVAAYDTAETPRAVFGAGAREAEALEFARALQAVARDEGLVLRGDGRLALLAQRLAREPASDARALGESARSFGLGEVAIEHRIVRSARHEPLSSAVAKNLSGVLRTLHATHFGAFLARDASSASVVLTRRSFVLAPVARRVALGTTLVLRGRLAATFRDPKLAVTNPAGAITLPAGEGPEFDLRVPTQAAGEYRLLLQATASEQRQTLAELVVTVGDARPAAADAPSPAADAPTMPARIAQGLYARCAALRARSGLAPLQPHAGLQRRAEQMSQAFALGSVPDESPPPSGLVLRAIARGADEQALWDALVHDAAQRARLQSTDVSHIGIGVARAADGFVAAQVLAQLTQVAFDDLAPARVLSALNHNRGARGGTALRPDPALTRVAADAAREFFAHPERSEREIMQRANDAVARFGLSYGRVTAVAVLVADPTEAAALEPALDPRARAVGIAVTRGERPDSVPGGVAVVLALGYERE